MKRCYNCNKNKNNNEFNIDGEKYELCLCCRLKLCCGSEFNDDIINEYEDMINNYEDINNNNLQNNLRNDIYYNIGTLISIYLDHMIFIFNENFKFNFYHNSFKFDIGFGDEILYSLNDHHKYCKTLIEYIYFNKKCKQLIELKNQSKIPHDVVDNIIFTFL